jgi:hypothetical protein
MCPHFRLTFGAFFLGGPLFLRPTCGSHIRETTRSQETLLAVRLAYRQEGCCCAGGCLGGVRVQTQGFRAQYCVRAGVNGADGDGARLISWLEAQEGAGVAC